MEEKRSEENRREEKRGEKKIEEKRRWKMGEEIRQAMEWRSHTTQETKTLRRIDCCR